MVKTRASVNHTSRRESRAIGKPPGVQHDRVRIARVPELSLGRSGAAAADTTGRGTRWERKDVIGKHCVRKFTAVTKETHERRRRAGGACTAPSHRVGVRRREGEGRDPVVAFVVFRKCGAGENFLRGVYEKLPTFRL
jgi:hypothetical protein